MNVYLEIGQKKVIAGALDWPGWNRLGRDEVSALQALFDHGPRYARALRSARLGFRAPADISGFQVVERLKGNATTDFGVPVMSPKVDSKPMEAAEMHRCQALLKACWRAFDAATAEAEGKALTKGPRGGGRQLEAIVQHVLGSDMGYLAQLGAKFKPDLDADPVEQMHNLREAILQALPAAARGEFPKRGPRGGLRWLPRYYVRRSAWHVLDHVWEIEDRSSPPG